jgi:hypothetical protein
MKDRAIYYFSLVSLLIIGLFLRIMYLKTIPEVYTTLDTYEYYKVGNDILAEPTLANIVNIYRTPLYPVFLSLAAKVTGNFGVPVYSQEFLGALTLILVAQFILGLIAIIFLYKTLMLLKLSSLWAFLISLFLIFNINIFSWESSLLSEGLSASFLIILTYLTLRVIIKPSKKILAFLLFGYILGVLLRPAFVLLPLTTLPAVAYLLKPFK